MKTQRFSLALCIALQTALVLSGCSKDEEDPQDEGDGDGDGDGDTSGDGDGDGDGDGTGDGDGDGDGTGDGDGDGDGAGDGDGDGDGTFVPPSDGGGISTCDPFLQDCPDGEKCVAYQSVGDTWDANKCVEVMGNGAKGDPCIYDGAVAATDDCNEETFCFQVVDVDGVNMGTCFNFCGGTANNPICEGTDYCMILNSGSINACVEPCDPTLQACEDGLGCYWGQGTFSCRPTVGGWLEGEECGYNNDCNPGLFCASAEVLPACNGASCCTNYCDLNEADICTDGKECTPFFAEGEAPPEFTHVGLCVLPG